MSRVHETGRNPDAGAHPGNAADPQGPNVEQGPNEQPRQVPDAGPNRVPLGLRPVILLSEDGCRELKYLLELNGVRTYEQIWDYFQDKINRTKSPCEEIDLRCSRDRALDRNEANRTAVISEYMNLQRDLQSVQIKSAAETTTADNDRASRETLEREKIEAGNVIAENDRISQETLERENIASREKIARDNRVSEERSARETASAQLKAIKVGAVGIASGGVAGISVAAGGAKLGALIGTAVLGPVGTAAGGAIGAIVGGVAVAISAGIGGTKIAEAVLKYK